MKKIILIIAFLLILIAIPVTLLVVRQRQDIRQKAVPASTIYVDPPTKSVNVGETFTVDVIIETNQNKVGAAEIKAVYNTNYIEAKSIQKGDFLPSVLVEGIVGNGSATITVANDRNNPAQANGVSGTGTVALITFEAKQATGDTPTTIQLSDSEASTADPEDFGKNIIISYQNGEVTVTDSGSNPSPTPSPQTSPSPGPSGASPTPSASPQQTTKITTPTNGSTVTTRRPRIAGESFVNGSVTLTVNPNSVIASTLTADANGDWEYTPTVDLANGTYTATVLGENSSGTQETATSTFTVSVGTGGDAIATPSPSASTTPDPSASASSEIPVTGSTTPTLLILMTALLLLAFGVKAIFL